MFTHDRRRVAFLRSVEIQRAAPHVHDLADELSRAGADAALFFTDGECGAGDFPGEAQRLRADTSPAEIVERIMRWRADAFVSISLRDENAVRDAVVAAELGDRGVVSVMHPPETVCLLANKADTKAMLRRAGFDVPDDVVIDGDVLNGRTVTVPGYREHLTRTAAERLGFPLLYKPLWESFGNGIRYIDGPAALADLLERPPDGSALLERCLEGELCSVEIVGAEGRYVRQPLIWKGETGKEPAFLFGRLRWAGRRPTADREFEPIGERLITLCSELGLRGAVEVEMIFRDGRYDIIEVNPRVSGTTLLSIAGSGYSTYSALLKMALGWWPDTDSSSAPAVRWAMEFPVRHTTPAVIRDLATSIDVVRAGTLRISGEEHGGNVVACCEFGREQSVLAALAALDARHGFLDPPVLGDIRNVLTCGIP